MRFCFSYKTTTSAPEAPSGLRRWALACLLALACLAVYGSAVRNDFLQDDVYNITQNTFIRDLGNLPKLFSRDYFRLAQEGAYRPVPTAVLFADHALWGCRVEGYRSVSIAWHILATLLFFWLVVRLLEPTLGTKRANATAFLAALLFAVHPIHGQTISVISYHEDIICCVFMLASFHLHLSRRPLLALAAFVLALLSKEMAVTLPAVLVLHHLLFEPRGARDGALSRLKPHGKTLAAFAALAGLFVLGRFTLFKPVGIMMEADTARIAHWPGLMESLQNALAAPIAYARYLGLLLWPARLSVDWDSVLRHAPASGALLASSVLLVAGLVWAARRCLRRAPPIAFGILFFLLTLLPVSGIVPFWSSMAERYAYIPSLGLFLVAGCVLESLWRGARAHGRPDRARRFWRGRAASFENWKRPALLAGLGLAVAAAPVSLAVRTVVRNRDCADELTLYLKETSDHPASYGAWYGLGFALGRQGRYLEAKRAFLEADGLDQYHKTHFMLGYVEEKLGGPPAAIEREYARALALEPEYYPAHLNLASFLHRQGRLDSAIAHYRRALSIKPDFREARANLGAAYLSLGRLEDARRELAAGLAVSPELDTPSSADLEAKLERNLAAARRWPPAKAGAARPLLADLRKLYPRLDPKWDKAERLEYHRTSEGLRPKTGYQGSSQSPESLKPEERAALDALALRERAPSEVHALLPADASGVFVLDQDGVSIETRMLGSLPAPARQESGLVAYPGAYAKTQALFTADARSLEQLFFLESPRAPSRFESELRVRGGTLRKEENGELAVYAPSGSKRLGLSRPMILDAKGREAAGDYELREAGASYVVALTFDPTGLAYPLLIDPVWTGAGAGSLATARAQHSATLLPNGKVLVAGGVSGAASLLTAELYDPAAGAWSATGSMATARYGQSATLLADGKVLVAGGYNSVDDDLVTAELYDPAAGTWSATGSMATARETHSATFLPNGKVLAAGGYNGVDGQLLTAELYDPAAGTWSATGSMATARDVHAAALLPNGKVLVAGGYNSVDEDLATAELYDPAAGTWSATGSLSTARQTFSATLLANGKVLAAGGSSFANGYLRTAELYNPAAGTWSATGSLASARNEHAAALLPNGKALAAGGRNSAVNYLATVEIYDPSAGTWSAAGSMATARKAQTGTLLPDGKLLMAGGFNAADGDLPTAELYNPSAGAWAAAGSLATARLDHSATLLPNGKVLVAGGYTGAAALATSELYDPAAGTWSATGSLSAARRLHAAVLLPNGKVLAAGGEIPGTYLSSAELYDPASGSWSPTGALGTARSHAPSALLASGKVLIAGGVNSGIYLPTAEVYDPAAGTWAAAGSLATARSDHTATVLANGNVLVAGGFNGVYLPTAELYDPLAGTWSATGSLGTLRDQHTATLLADGKVLVAAGYAGTALSTAELYDPSAGTWSATGPLATARDQHTSTLLPNGKVLVAGGWTGAVAYLTAELYDPSARTWSTAGPLATARREHTATLLPDGKILVAGGAGAAALATTESAFFSEYDFNIATKTFTRPAILAVNGWGSTPVSVTTGAWVSVTGSTFTGVSEGSGGNTQMASPANAPRAYLRPLDTGNAGSFSAGSMLVDVSTSIYANAWSSTALTFRVPAYLRPGYYLFWAQSNAVPSDFKVLNVIAAGGAAPGCGTNATATAGGASIQAAVNAAPTTLTAGDHCVLVNGGTFAEQVTVQGIDTNGFRVVISSTPGATVTVSPPAASTAAFVIANASVTLAGFTVLGTNAMPYGVLTSSADAAISRVIVNSNNKIYAAGVAISSRSSLSYSSITVQSADGLLIAGSNATVSLSTMTSNAAGRCALYVDAAGSNTVTGSNIQNPSGWGAALRSGAHDNTITLSTMISNAAGYAALWVAASDSNTVAGSYMQNLAGDGARLETGADGNTIRQSTMISNAAGYAALWVAASGSNTVTASTIRNLAGWGAALRSGADGNTISLSTMVSNAAGRAAFGADASGRNTVTASYIQNLAGDGARLESGADFNTITLSAMTSDAAGYYALYVLSSASNTVSGSTLRGSTAAFVAGSTGTVIGGSVLVGTNTAGTALALAGGSLNLTLSSSALAGGGQGIGLYIDANNTGVISLGSVTVGSSRYGVALATQAAGFSLAVDSITFRGLAAGATAFHFLGGTFVSTITLADFEDTTVGANVNASALDLASRITMKAYRGARTGPVFEDDPGSLVEWWFGLHPGCAVTKDVGSGHTFATISAALADLKADNNPLSGHSCVVILDGAVYPEQVTVQGFTNNGSSITIFADAASGLRPVVSPPASSTGAFVIRNDSVSIRGIDVLGANAMPYGVLASSAYVTISSVNVNSAGKIGTAGIAISSWSAVSDSSVTVQAAHGVWLTTGAIGTSVSYSSAQAGSYALYLTGASSNTFTAFVASAPAGGGACFLGAQYNSVSLSTFVGGAGRPAVVLDAGSSTNTFQRSSFYNALGKGVSIQGSSSYNALSQLTIASLNDGLTISGSSSNAVSQSFISGAGRPLYLLLGAGYNSFSQSTFTTTGATQALYATNAASNTFTQCHFGAPAGGGAQLSTASDWNTISQSTIASNATGFFPALHLRGVRGNTVTGSYIVNPSSNAVYLESLSSAYFTAYNTIRLSTIATNSTSPALQMVGVASNVVTQTSIDNPSGRGAFFLANSSFNVVTLSAITANAAGQAGVDLTSAAFNTISYSSVRGSPAVFISGSTGTAVDASVLAAADPGGWGLQLTGGSVGLSMSSNTILGGASGGGLSLEAGNTGSITLASTTVTAALYGMVVDAQPAKITVASMTFSGLAAGATALQFLAGVEVATLTYVSFAGPGLSVNVNGSLLAAGSRIALCDASGSMAGPAYENDPAGYVEWLAGCVTPTPPSNCSTLADVKLDGSLRHKTIQSAVDALAKNLAGDACVVVRDTQTYAEQVTVQGFANNGFRVRIMADPGFVSSAPVVSPPAASNGAFIIRNDSVSIAGINVLGTNAMSYGVLASSADVAISSVNVDGGGHILTAGIAVSSRSAVSNSSVTAQGGYGLVLTGSWSSVTASTMTCASAGLDALFLNGASSNTVTRSRISNPAGRAARLGYACCNSITLSRVETASGGDAALEAIESSSNTVAQSFILGGQGLILSSNSNANTLSQSTVTSDAAGSAALSLGGVASNTITGSYIQGPNAVLVGGSTGTVIKGSVLAATDSTGRGLWVTGGAAGLSSSSNTITGGPDGFGVYLDSANTGAISSTSDTIKGPRFGLLIASQTAKVSVASMTFAGVPAGATAVKFLGGVAVSTLAYVGFGDANIAVNVDASLLAAGSRITACSASGPRAGSFFEVDANDLVGWYVDCGSGARPRYTLTVVRMGPGAVFSTPAGIDCGETCTAEFTDETVVALSAQRPVTSTFAGWKGANCAGTGGCVVVMNSAISVAAAFNQQTGNSVNYPNPFGRAGTKFAYVLTQGGDVSIRIYSMSGQLVNTIYQSGKAPGFNETAWNGKDMNGQEVARGLYRYQLRVIRGASESVMTGTCAKTE
ncbi:MAG: right-handed parallel beta-helix repeat-containing protein [Elusimicrobia bacterium]|nr:right-handed parallel beta-helix repeat-containing protein [Elusimicrobiota bacterium]